MLDRTRLKERLKIEEGVRLKPYKDSLGYWTIGVGHLMTNKEIALYGGGITEEKAEELLDDDITVVFLELNKHLPWWKELDDARQMVIADMCFNLGIKKLLQFKNTLAAVKEKRWEAAANGMMNSLWARQVGNRAKMLAEIMRTGKDDCLGAPKEKRGSK